MKKLEKMNKLIVILSIVLMVALAVQIVMVFMPFFEDRTPDKTAKVPNPIEDDYSMMDYAFFQTEETSNILAKELKGNGKYYINDYVMGIVFAFALGATALVANAASTKSIFTNIVSALWAIAAPLAFLTDEVMALGNQTVLLVCIISSCLGAVVALARLYPWFCVKFMAKKFKDQEKAQLAAQQ